MNKKYEYYNDFEEYASMGEMIKSKALSRMNDIAFKFIRHEQMIEITYKKFYIDVCSLAKWLMSENITEKHIAIIEKNCYEWIVFYFAAVISGNVAVLINKDLPEDTIGNMLEMTDVDVIIGKQEIREKKYVNNTRFINTDEFETYADMYKDVDILQEDFHSDNIDLDKCCSIFFTSGTTGYNKGVCLSQKNIMKDAIYSCKMVTLYGDGIAVLPFYHAFGLVAGVFCVFLKGYPLFINSRIKYLKRDMAIVHPNLITMVPLFIETFYQQIMVSVKKEKKERLFGFATKLCLFLLHLGIDARGIFFKDIQEQFGGNLRYIICGGASLDPFYIKTFRAIGIEIINGYGITECSPCVAANRNLYHKDNSVGQILPEINVKIAEDGEIVVKGDIVMLGYYKDSVSTEMVLKDGWYYTGDLGHIDKDGFLYVTGRKKNLIILSNGENVSPEEIEASYKKDEGVKEVLVYSENGLIIAEIFPEDDYLGNVEYFERLRKLIDKDKPINRRVSKILLRDKEFEKTATMKIKRYKR